MKEAATKKLRQMLEAQVADATAKLRRLGISPDEDQHASSRPDSQSVNDIGDVAQVSESRDLEFGTRERLAERISRLNAALRRLDDGSYGTCERCGRPIQPARLEAIPEAAFCRDCQEEIERGERSARPASL